MGELLEKFVANFIDTIMEHPNPNWGTTADFCISEESFRDPNKRTNTENQLGLLKQGGKKAERSSSRSLSNSR